MSFQITSNDIRISEEDGSTWLIANAQEENGAYKESRIRLDEFIGNIDGHFQWHAENFTQSAQNITLSIEGADSVPVLRAELADVDGNWHARDINLGERIENDNGNLKFT